MAVAGSATVLYQESRSVRWIEWDWIADASGNVSGGAGLTKAVSGQIVRITTVPGSPAPTANYDMVINDQDVVDVAAGTLQNRHTTNTESVVPSVAMTPTGGSVTGFPSYCDGPLELVVSNAGNLGAGTVRLYFR